MADITSITNPTIKEIVALRDRKKRDQTRLTIVEGLREISAALSARWSLQDVFISEGFDIQSLKLNKKAIVVSKKVFSKIGYGQKQEGVLALFKQKSISLKQLKISSNPLIVVADAVEKPGNLGAILRTSDAAGVDAVCVSDGKTDIYNPNTIRASLGAIFTMPLVECSVQDMIAYCHEKKIQICVASPDAQKEFTECDLKKPTALVVGSEKDGLGKTWINNADEFLRIPMRGKVDSLNVSASTAIILYEAIRQRR